MNKFVLLIIFMLIVSISIGQRVIYRMDSLLNNPLLINNADYKQYSKIIIVTDDSVEVLNKAPKNAKIFFANKLDSLSILKVLRRNKSSNFLMVEVTITKKEIDLMEIRFLKSHTSYNMFSGNTYLNIKNNPILNINLQLYYNKTNDIWYP